MSAKSIASKFIYEDVVVTTTTIPRVLDSMAKMHGETDMTQLAAASWNVFRYLGDYMHLAGIAVLLLTIAKNRSVAGISKQTQILYLIVFVTRYLDIFDPAHQTAYLITFKLIYILTAASTVIAFQFLDSTYERRIDSCNKAVILFPCLLATVLLTEEYSIVEGLWTFSEFLEAIAMVPQYIFCYRQRKAQISGPTVYVMFIGVYRVFYALNWVYKKIMMPHYSDVQSWLGGVIEILFFLDFLNYNFVGSSCLRSMVLTVDTKVNEISDGLELKILGSSSAKRAQAHEENTMRNRRGKDAPAAEV